MERIADLLHSGDPKSVTWAVVAARSFPEFADDESGPVVAAALMAIRDRLIESTDRWAFGTLGDYMRFLSETDRLSTARALLAGTESPDAHAVRGALRGLIGAGAHLPPSEVPAIVRRVARMAHDDRSRYGPDLPAILDGAIKSAARADREELMRILVEATKEATINSLARFAKSLVENEGLLGGAAKRVLVGPLLAQYEAAERLELAERSAQRLYILVILAVCRPVMEPAEFTQVCKEIMEAARSARQIPGGFLHVEVLMAWADLLPREPLAELLSMLDERLKGPRSGERSTLVWWLARWSPTAPPWISGEVNRILQGLKDDPDPDIRAKARKALGLPET